MGYRRILKYPINPLQCETEIKCHFIKILDIQMQNSEMMAWILTDGDAPEKTISIIPVGTGWEVPTEILNKYEYIKTVQDDCGYVWHYHISKK